LAKKLAITVAGAVSLGSYEAGVAFEVLDAIAQHNRWADQSNLSQERIEIDVLTGASAGGMTVAMIAQRLLFEGPAMSLPYDNPLFNAWVRDIDIVKLLERGPNEPPSHSVFSSDCVVAISQAWLTARYNSLPVPSPQPHPALPLDGTLQLGLALSNLNGVDYCRPTLSGSTFVYTNHQDEDLFSMDTASSDRFDLWERIRSTAVACGAFPVAFRVQDLCRAMVDYSSPWLDKSLWAGAPSRYFGYTDGGVLQNQPLGMAKNLVDALPGGHLTAEQRGYLFISPQPKTSSAVPYTTDEDADPSSALGSANANYKGLVIHLAESVIGQAAFQDWIVAEQVNEKLEHLDQRANQLQTLFLTGQLTAAQTEPVSLALLRTFFQVDGVMTPVSLANLETARDQLRRQYDAQYLKFGMDTTTGDAWIDSVLVLELAAGLHEKEEMRIYDFVADPTTLAGGGLDAFEGFFDIAYRKHDYDCGRTVAQQNLIAYREKPGSVFANLHWTPRPIDPIDSSLNSIRMSRVDKKKRRRVCRELTNAAEALLEEIGTGFIVRKVVRMILIRRRIKKMLDLS
jgi:hypothetical protein